VSKPDSLPLTVAHEVRDVCICMHTQRAARALARRFDEAFAPLNLTNGQYSLLMSLSGPAPPGMGALAQALAMDRTTLTSNLKPLQRRGLVEVAVDRNDKRGRKLRLTQAGRRLLAKAVPIWRRSHAKLDRRVSRKKLATIRAGLMELI
jgi:DNA-binding MarR family transcriptional regulator